VLRDLGLAQDRRLASHVVYRLAVPAGACGRMVRAVLEALRADPAFKAESAAARVRTRVLVEGPTLFAAHGA